MTSIRAQLDAHTPILAQKADKAGRYVLIEKDDLNELSDIAQQEVLCSPQGDKYVIETDVFQQLVRDAHDMLHGDHAPKTPEQRLIEAAFGPGTTFPLSEDEEAEGAPESVEDDENGEQRRNVAMHYATQILIEKLRASAGLDFEINDDSVVSQAAAIDKFIKG